MNSLPLAGKRVLITRAKDQGSRLQLALQAAGARVIAIPAIEIIPPESYDALDAALHNISSFDWLVLTSANAVRVIDERCVELSIAATEFAPIQIAAIGNATAEALAALGLSVALIPPRAVAESLAEALASQVRGKRVLLARAKVARDLLPDALIAAGAHLTIAEAYQTVIPEGSAKELREVLLASQTIDAIVFTSASTVHNLVALAQAGAVAIPGEIKKISIGPITTSALAEEGMQVDSEAEHASIEDLVTAVVRSFA